MIGMILMMYNNLWFSNGIKTLYFHRLFTKYMYFVFVFCVQWKYKRYLSCNLLKKSLLIIEIKKLSICMTIYDLMTI